MKIETLGKVECFFRNQYPENMEILEAMPGDVILCVSITKKYKTLERGSLYETARKYWPVKEENIGIITHVVAVNKGRVIAVYPHPKWQKTENSNYKGRYEFISDTPSGDPNSPYLGKYVRMCFNTKYLK